MDGSHCGTWPKYFWNVLSGYVRKWAGCLRGVFSPTKYKRMQKSWEITETLASGYSSERTQRELSNEYKHDRV